MEVNCVPPWHVLADAYSKTTQNNIKDSVLGSILSSFIGKYRGSWCSGYRGGFGSQLCFDGDWPE
jgi:hypothetical protein